MVLYEHAKVFRNGCQTERYPFVVRYKNYFNSIQFISKLQFKREIHPIFTLDLFVEDNGGSKFFSKTDMSEVYAQINLL